MSENTNRAQNKSPKSKKNSFAEKINRNKLMVEGLKANAVQVSKRGADEAFIDEISSTIAAAEGLNVEQETLKGALKKKTKELKTAMVSLKKRYSEAKKIVKMTVDQTRWVEFGITDKR